MAVRYYPSFRVNTNQTTRGGEYYLNGSTYVGPYYTTYDGQAFTGPNPSLGPNEPLQTVAPFDSSNVGLYSLNGSPGFVNQMIKNTNLVTSNTKSLVSYFPNPLQSDYDLGYINRYFGKQINNSGYIKEISPQQYQDITSGNPSYNISMLQVIQISWKLTGPLNSIRISQYDVRAGIIDTNKRLVEAANPNFFGLVEFIGGNYSKYAKPTQ
jgi:hypothetical protein